MFDQNQFLLTKTKTFLPKAKTFLALVDFFFGFGRKKIGFGRTGDARADAAGSAVSEKFQSTDTFLINWSTSELNV